jgi:hypothetical protein
MSGVVVVRYLLSQNAAVLAVVPAARIKAGDLPLSTTMPAIGIKQVSSVPFNLIRTNESGKLHTDRVQVTGYFKDEYGSPAGTGVPGIEALLKLILAACPSQRGAVNGIAVENIVPDLEGPDMSIPELNIVMRSRDLIVKWVGA